MVASKYQLAFLISHTFVLMQIPKLNHQDLKPWLDRLEMIKACAEQTIKDLSMYGIHIDFTGNPLTAFEELFDQIKPAIEHRIDRGQTISEILYRVDVNEDTVKHFLESDHDIASALTILILYRELQKVVTRFLISNPKQQS